MAASSSDSAGPIVTSSSIKVIAEAVGISNLKDEVAEALAPDVEYRLRDLVQGALKFAKHGRRDHLTTEDINYALRLRNCEPLYGFASPDPPKFCRALTKGVFYLEDPELNLADLLAEPLPRVPIHPSFSMHWLAINGVQPRIPQNPTEEEIAAQTEKNNRKRPRGGTEYGADDAGAAADGSAASAGEGGVVGLAKHALTAEEQNWLERVTQAVREHVPNKDGIVDPEKAKVHDAETARSPPRLSIAHFLSFSSRSLPSPISSSSPPPFAASPTTRPHSPSRRTSRPSSPPRSTPH